MVQKILIILFLAITSLGCTREKKQSLSLGEPVTMLQTPATDSCGEPYLFTGTNGLIYLSWIEKKDKVYHLRFSTLSDDKWSEPVSIASGNNWFVNWADYPVIAASGDKHLLAHYLERSDSGIYTYDIKYITSADKGKSWASPRLLNEDGKKAEHGFVSILPFDQKYILSWLDGRNTVDPATMGHEGHHGQMTLRAALLGTDGTREQEWELDDRVCDCCQTSISITNAGPVVIYRDRSKDEIRDIGIVRLTNNSWTKPQIVHADNWKIEGCPVNGPRVAAIGNTVAVAWFTGKNDSGDVKVVFSGDAGANFGPPVKLSESKSIGRVDLVMIGSNKVVASWMEGSAIRMTTVRDDGSRDESLEVVKLSESRSTGFPQMTRSGDKIFLAWTDNQTKSIKCASIPLVNQNSSLHVKY